MALERIPRPFIRSRAEEEKKENEFDQPLDAVSGKFFDDFVRENVGLIRSDSLGILSQNLEVGINELMGRARREKGEEFSTNLERYLLDDLRNCRYLVPDTERDSLVKRKVEAELASDLKEKGIEVEE